MSNAHGMARDGWYAGKTRTVLVGDWDRLQSSIWSREREGWRVCEVSPASVTVQRTLFGRVHRVEVRVDAVRGS